MKAVRKHKKASRITLSDVRAPAVVNINGLELSIDGEGNAVIKGSGDITLITDGAVTAQGYAVDTNENGEVKLHPLQEGDELQADPSIHRSHPTECSIGDQLPDGWVIAGISPDTGTVFSVEPEDQGLMGYHTWHAGVEHVETLRSEGHRSKDARLPSRKELNVIYNEIVEAGRNNNAKMNVNDHSPYGKYWSSKSAAARSPDEEEQAWLQYFSDGNRVADVKENECARVRCVRSEPNITLKPR